MSTATLPEVLTPIEVSETHTHHEKPSLWGYLWSYDHKIIALQYFWTAFLFLFIGGALALGIRYQLGFPNHPIPIIGHLLPSTLATDDGAIIPGGYNMLVTMHATIMVFFVVMPILIGTFGNFLIPLQIGAGDMAFPLLNEVSYWLYALSGVVMLGAFFMPGGAPGTGWTAYAPLSAVAAYNQTQLGQSLWGIGIFINGLSSITGATNYITTIITMRAPGMKMFRLPLATWALFVTAILLIFAVPVLSAAAAMLFTDLNLGTSFFKPLGGGQPLLWQHLFWFFGHPEVYIMILPAMGLVSEIMPVFSRKPIFGYKAMVYAMLCIGFLGFIVWGHHMFVSGMSLTLSATFSLSTMVIAVPSGIKTFNWLGTIWRGSIEYVVPMCFALAFVSMFVIGGLSGIFMASTPVDLEVKLTKRPVFSMSFSPYTAPTGPVAELSCVDVTSNPRVHPAVERIVSDDDVPSVNAICELYKKGIDENSLHKLLSVGLLGRKKDRKLVPTRWGITATDDQLGKILLSTVQDLAEMDYQAFFGGYLGNYYLILCFSGVWSYELFEMYLPRASFNDSDQIQFSTDYEPYDGRTQYAQNCTGGYYAPRLAILEKMKSLKRQGSVVALRIITEEYTMPLGVWVCREAARKALESEPIHFADMDLMIRYAQVLIKKKFGYAIDKVLNSSIIIKNRRSQSKLSEFF